MREDYPIYVVWYQLLNEIIDKIEKFPKSIRFTLSDRIMNLSLDVLELIIEAIYTTDRAQILKKMNIYIEKIRIYIRLSTDRKYLSLNQYAYLIEKLDEFGRMIGGWTRKIEKV